VDPDGGRKLGTASKVWGGCGGIYSLRFKVKRSEGTGKGNGPWQNKGGLFGVQPEVHAGCPEGVTG